MERITFFGDSITACKSFPESLRWTGLVQAELDRIAPNGYQVFNRGIGGNTSFDGLNRFEVDVAGQLPGIVVIEFGFNDANVTPNRRIPRCNLASFVENLGEIVRLVKAGKGKPVLVANHPITEQDKNPQGNGRSYNRNFQPYQPAIREVAAKLKIPLIDLEKELKGIPPEDFLSEDGMHLSLEGCRVYGAAVLNGLRPVLRLK